MVPLFSGLSYVDLQFLGRPRVIATAVLQAADGAVLIDPGPSSCLPTLRAALERAGIPVADVRALLLTHIHLDHAGATGTLVGENPAIRVYVHERGAPHLVDPQKLLASATRLYRDNMDRLWGECLPVPPENLHALSGGEAVTAGGRTFEVAYTPGHASHHVSYFARDIGLAFVGDTAGIKVRPDGYVMPPTPPPDIDLGLWRASAERILAWHPDTLFLTHFGPSSPPAPHLQALLDHLDRVSRLVGDSLRQAGPDENKSAWFTEHLRLELRRSMTEEDARGYELAGGGFDLNWQGLARYWRKRAAA